MELAHIKYFLAVCEARHFTRAAIACGISQPSLSVAIARLEKELGEPLFDRGPPVRLTPLGEAVKPYFRTIWRNIIQIQRLAEIRVPERTGRRSQIGIQRKQQIVSVSQHVLLNNPRAAEQETAALQDFDPAYDCSGSK